MDYNEKLRELRVQSGMSQDNLAEKLHVARQTISKWEQGVNEPDIYTLKQYATIFNVTIDEIVGDVGHVNTSANKHKMACKTLLFISTAFYAVCVLTVFILFRFLQNEIPAYFDGNGKIGRYGNKAEVLLHLISFTLYYAFILLTYFVGKRNLGTPLPNLEKPSFIVIFSIVVAVPIGYLAFVLAIFTQYLLDKSLLSFITCIIGAMELAIAILAHPKITSSNSFLGFRTEFTLTNPKAWVKVNKFASICISLAAALMLTANMIWISLWAVLASTITLFVALIISLAYHEMLRKKMKK